MKHWAHKFTVFGWVTPDICVELGTLETDKRLSDIWDILYLTFQDGTCPEGIFARELKDEESKLSLLSVLQ